MTKEEKRRAAVPVFAARLRKQDPTLTREASLRESRRIARSLDRDGK